MHGGKWMPVIQDEEGGGGYKMETCVTISRPLIMKRRHKIGLE